MGGSQNKETLPELKDMDLIKADIYYKIYEKGDKQVELWEFETTEQNQKAETQFIEQIKSKECSSLTKIINHNLQTVDKSIFTTVKMFTILTEHPKYTLREVFYGEKLPNKKQLNSQEIIDLTMQIIGAQLVLGSKGQFLSFNNIFTNDGDQWMLKPFFPTISGFESFKKFKNFEGGFPAPEENKMKQYDVSRVQMFGFGLILVELILGKHTIEKLYDKKGVINQNALNDKTLELQQQKYNYSDRFIEFVTEMIDSDLSRRPSFKKLSEKFQTSLIISNFRKDLEGKPITLTTNVNLFSAESNIMLQIKDRIIKVESSIEIILSQKSKKLQSSMDKISSKKVIQLIDGTSYQGDIIEGVFQGEGKLFSKSGEKVYEGEFKNGKFHGFGMLYYQQNKAFQDPLDYKDLTKFDQYAKEFEGDFLDGKKCGQGQVTFYNGEKFVGDLKDDQPHGYGQFTNMNQIQIAAHWNYGIVNNTYISDESQDLKPNNLISTRNLIPPSFTDNKSFTSNYQIKKLELQEQLLKSNMEMSKEILQDVKRQKDYFLNMKFTGQAEQYFQSGLLEYSGDFNQGLYDGVGSLYNEHTNKYTQIDVLNFNTIFQNNAWFKYSGSFKMGKKDGEGSLILTDMSEYQGQFQNDNVHGEGLVTRKNQDDILGVWEKGKLVKIITRNI